MRTSLAPLLMVALLLAAVSCSSAKHIRSEPPPMGTDANAQPPKGTVVNAQPAPGEVTISSDFYQSGTASWYGDDFQGKTTADGEIYDMRKLTAAHQTLPFHTLVEVENLENGKKVVVRINDRGPFLKDRIIDLSLLAAQRLDMADQGTAAVNIRVIRMNAVPVPSASPGAGNSGAACCVQAGAFAVRENADDLLLTLAEIFPDLRFSVIVEDGMFKVLSEKLSPAARCREILAKMAEFHLQGFAREPDIAHAE
jgi:rare lipoprotein A